MSQKGICNLTVCLSFHWHRVLHFCTGMRRNLNYEKVTYVFRFLGFFPIFYRLSFFSFSYLFAAVIDHLLGVFPVHTILRKHHRDGNFYLRILTCGRRILFRVFHSNFWAFSCKCQAPLSRSLWSGYHWKDSSCGDVRSGTKTKARHSRLRATRESMGNIPSK